MSRARVLFRPRALLDLHEQAVFIAVDNPSASLRFLDAAKATCADLLAHPFSGVLRRFTHPRLAELELRVFPVHGLPRHLVLYVPSTRGIEVVRIIHGARDLPTVLKAS